MQTLIKTAAVGLKQVEGQDGLKLEEALKHSIKRMGIKEFCDGAGIAMPNVVNFLNGRRKLKVESLDAFLSPFGLRIKIGVEKAS